MCEKMKAEVNWGMEAQWKQRKVTTQNKNYEVCAFNS